MQDKDLFSNFTMQELLDQLDVIECFERPECELRIGEITVKQKQLYQDFGFSPPASL
jgi:hypothetical protein